jgi:hypothetical protein
MSFSYTRLFSIMMLVASSGRVFSQKPDNTVWNNKQNVLSIAPFAFTENGLGLECSYERIGDRGIISFCLPLLATFNIANTNRIYNYNTGYYNTGNADAMFYLMPGIKIYPRGSHKKLTYATGADAVIASGQKSSYYVNMGGLNIAELVQSHFLYGAVWQNSLNINYTSRLYMGIETGIGSSIINKIGGVVQNNELLINGALKVGYRF